MIRIENLTQRQRQIMDLLWHCDDITQLNTLIQALPTERDRCDAQSLVQIAIWESDELEGELAKYEQTAKDCISRCSSK